MRPDVIASADHLPFDDGSFDVVACRIAAHHFPDLAAVEEMARVSGGLLVIEDVLFDGEGVEEAHRLRDPTHVRCYSEDEWRRVVTMAGFEVEQVELFEERRLALEPWLDRVEVPADDRPRIRELLGDAADGDTVRMPIIVLQARKSQR
jgi:Methyltransferase domain